MHVHAMVPGQRPRTAKSCKGGTRVPDALIGTYQLRETTPTENPRSSKVAGGWAQGQQPNLGKITSLKNRNGRLNKVQEVGVTVLPNWSYCITHCSRLYSLAILSRPLINRRETFHLTSLSDAKIMQYYWKMNEMWVWSIYGFIWQGKTEVLGAKHFLLSLHIPQIHVDCSGVEFGVVRWPEVTWWNKTRIRSSIFSYGSKCFVIQQQFQYLNYCVIL